SETKSRCIDGRKKQIRCLVGPNRCSRVPGHSHRRDHTLIAYIPEHQRHGDCAERYWQSKAKAHAHTCIDNLEYSNVPWKGLLLGGCPDWLTRVEQVSGRRSGRSHPPSVYRFRGSPATVTLTANISALYPGSYTGTVWIATLPNQSPVSLPVQV